MYKKKLEPSIENVLTKKEKTVKKVLKSTKGKTLSSDNTVKGIAPVCIYPGMYVYDDNFISKELIADRQVKAVVTYLDYHEKTVYAICPEINKLPWSSDCLDVNTRYTDGKRITQEIVKEAERTKKKAEAAQWCYSYAKNGVKAGEAFIPSSDEFRFMFYTKEDEMEDIISAVKRIGGNIILRGLWASDQETSGRAMYCPMEDGNFSDDASKEELNWVCPFIALKTS